jgi:hypothetical protein
MLRIKTAIAFAAISLGIAFNLSYPNKLLASRGLGSDPEQVNVMSIKSIEPRGLKLAQGWIVYNDGDTLYGLFRIYCPSKMIRPTNYTLVGRNRKVKKKGDWWEPAFKPKWKTEHELVSYTCRSSDF